MRWREHNRQTSLSGESLPNWAVFGLLLFGVVLSVSTAWLLISHIGVSIPTLNRDTAISVPSADTRLTEKTKPIVQGAVGEMVRETKKNTVAPDYSTTGLGAGTVHQSVSPADRPPLPQTTPTEPKATLLQPGIQTNINDLTDCPPLFEVRFKRNGVHPIALDLPEKVAHLITWLDAHPDAKVRIEGHASAGGPDDFNLIISYRRANSIAELLINAGIPSDRIITRAMGDQLPLQGIPPMSSKNQRVSLHIEGTHECSMAQDEENIQ